MYLKYGCVSVVFEVGRLTAKGGHAHVQAVPVPLRLKDKVEETFLREGRSMGVDFEEDPDSALESCSNGRGSYFKVELPDGRKMVHLLKDSIPFSIQFGRCVVIRLLLLQGSPTGFYAILDRHWSVFSAHLIGWIGRRVCCQRKTTRQMHRHSKPLLRLSIPLLDGNQSIYI